MKLVEYINEFYAILDSCVRRIYMKCDLVVNSAKSAIGNFLKNDKIYEESLKTFYSEGSKNPTMARILFQNEVIENAKVCKRTQSELFREYDNFTPSIKPVKVSDLQPQGILQEMLAESIIRPLNSLTKDFEELTHKQIKLLEMHLNKQRLVGSTKMLDELRTPESLKAEKMIFDKAFDSLYPKTGEVRKKLITYNIRTNRVTPRLSKNDRHLIFEPREGWLYKYPKTAGLRFTIIEGKKPQKLGILTRIKNIFKSAKTLEEEKNATLMLDYSDIKIAKAIKP